MGFDPATIPQGGPSASLQPRLIKGLQADFIPSIWPGKNTSGVKPYGKNVLVKMDECSAASAGGVMITDDMREKMTEGSETGCIFAIGPEAFRLFDDGHRWSGVTPEVGERVYVEKYAGIRARGADGGVYRVMDYRNIAAGLIDPEAEAQPSKVGL